MKKQYVILFIFILFMGVACFAQTTGMYNHSSDYQSFTPKDYPNYMPDYSTDSSLFDIPFVQGLTYFFGVIYYFQYIVRMLCAVCCLLCIIFHCFKLWAGTIEVKKMAVDVIYKCVICIILVIYFGNITTGVVRLATSFGTYCSGGFQHVNDTYTKVAYTLEQNLEKNTETMLAMYSENAFRGSDGKMYLDQATVDKMMTSVNMTQAEVEQWAKNRGIGVSRTVNEGFLGTPRQYNEEGTRLDGKWNFVGRWWQNRKTRNEIKKQKIDKSRREYIAKINALMEVLAERTIEEALDEDGKMDPSLITDAQSAVKTLFYNPFLANKESEATIFLAPSALLKSCTLMADVLGYAVGDDIGPDGGVKKKRLFGSEGTLFSVVESFLIGWIYRAFTWVCVVVVTVEYIVTLLEFFLVRGLATLLIPLMFIDATKSYAMNLLRLLLSYFFKILTTTITVFFALGIFLDTLSVILMTDNIQAGNTIVMFLSTVALAILFTLNSGKMASVIINGSPSMGIGDIARAGHATMHAIRTGAHAVDGAKNVAIGKKGADGERHGGMLQGGQAIVRAGGNAAGLFKGAWSSGKSTAADVRSAIESKEMAGNEGTVFGEGAAAFAKTIGAAGLQKAKDVGYKLATGKNRQHLGKDGSPDKDRFYGMGERAEHQEGFDGGRTNATFKDVAKQAVQAGESIAKRQVEIAKAKRPRNDGDENVKKVADTKPGHAESIKDLHSRSYFEK